MEACAEKVAVAESMWQLTVQSRPVAEASAADDAERIWADVLAPAPKPGDMEALQDLFGDETPKPELPVIYCMHACSP